MKANLLLMNMLMGQSEFWPKPETEEARGRRENNLRNEFNLIQQKKSKLSRRQRDNVVWQYNRLED